MVRTVQHPPVSIFSGEDQLVVTSDPMRDVLIVGQEAGEDRLRFWRIPGNSGRRP